MSNSEFWLSVSTDADRKHKRAGVGPVRVALLFGTVAVAMALLLPPVLDGGERMTAYNPGIDTMATGSIPNGDRGVRQYTLRRSIAQEPGSVCILHFGDNGSRC
jgi:hypothetical protein